MGRLPLLTTLWAGMTEPGWSLWFPLLGPAPQGGGEDCTWRRKYGEIQQTLVKARKLACGALFPFITRDGIL